MNLFSLFLSFSSSLVCRCSYVVYTACNCQKYPTHVPTGGLLLLELKCVASWMEGAPSTLVRGVFLDCEWYFTKVSGSQIAKFKGVLIYILSFPLLLAILSHFSGPQAVYNLYYIIYVVFHLYC